MKKISSSKMEGIGLIIILLTVGWQIFENKLEDSSRTIDRNQIHEKLDAIWGVVAETYSHSDLNKTQAIHSTDFQFHEQNWKYINQLDREKSTLDFQSTFFRTLEFVFFVLGSVLIIIPKFRNDHKTENQSI